MKGKGKLTQIYQLDVHYSLFQCQGKDLPDVETTSILTALKTWNPYLTVFITILQMTLKNAFYHVRILSNYNRKKYPKQIASKILPNRQFIRTNLIKRQHYLLIMETIDSKI